MLDHFDQYIKISKKISAETYAAVTDIEEPGRMADIVASHLPLKLKDKQDILETADIKERLNKVIRSIHNEKEVLEIEKKSVSASNVRWNALKRNIICANR